MSPSPLLPPTSPTASSLLLPNGKINIYQLENEIIQDISNDSLYHAEDEMKKRAVHTSKDYDEFKNFVACSQLKPVQSKQMRQLFVQRGGRCAGGMETESTRSSNKLCTVQQRNDKRLATLMSDILIDHDNKGCRLSSTECESKYGRKEMTNNFDTSIANTDKANDEFQIAFTGSKYNSSLEEILKINKYVGKNKRNKSDSIMNNTREKQKSFQKENTDLQKSQNNCIPRNAMELEREWKIYCRTPMEVLKYITLPKDEFAVTNNNMKIQRLMKMNELDLSTCHLPIKLRIEPEMIPKSICKIEINLTLLDGIIKALELLLQSKTSRSSEADKHMEREDRYELHTLSFVNRWMVAMTKCGRFSLNVEFLDDSQKKCITFILQSMETEIDQYFMIQPNCEKLLNLKSSIDSLKSLYKVDEK